MYCTMTCDSFTGRPAWSRTGTLLCTGLEARRRSLLSPRFSSTYSYGSDLRLRTTRTLIAYGLLQTPSSFSSPLPAIAKSLVLDR
ncbi:Os10g0530800 [Oryza sativa Japonica Group]|uniref:Os10g0530800 protein n=1 Tax=Oryza sativa subsp. japonica TaxID=39947 RepID=Q0IW61_ORYSJ|nr:Os10g0530800 [Oryza sativa Japonica Group]|eukprot:NP_001065140.1 Os10g0530800 [Oryza sativa Japonica Group]